MALPSRLIIVSCSAAAFLAGGCASPSSKAAQPTHSSADAAIQAVDAYRADRGRLPVSLSEVNFTDRSISYEAEDGAYRIACPDAGGHGSWNYDSQQRTWTHHR